MPISKLEQASFQGMAEILIAPKLPSAEKFPAIITGLLAGRENTQALVARVEALGFLQQISETAATLGQIDRDQVIGNYADQAIGIPMLNNGFQPFYFPPVKTDFLIDHGIIQNTQTIDMVKARHEAKLGRSGESAENSMVVWALDERERDLLLEEPPNIAELLTAIKSAGKPLSQVISRGPKPLDEVVRIEEVKARSTVARFLQTYSKDRSTYHETHLESPILALRESYTITIPADMIPQDIIEKHRLTREDIEGFEIDIRGVYILGKDKEGQLDLFFLGETQFPHRHIRTLGKDQRINIEDENQLAALGEICNALEIKVREMNPENVRATDGQIAAMLALMVYSVRGSNGQQ